MRSREAEIKFNRDEWDEGIFVDTRVSRWQWELTADDTDDADFKDVVRCLICVIRVICG